MYTTLPAIDNYTYCHSRTGNITSYFCLLLQASNNAKGNEHVMNTTCIFMWQTHLIWNIMRIIWSLFWWSHEGAELNPWNYTTLIESIFFFPQALSGSDSEVPVKKLKTTPLAHPHQHKRRKSKARTKLSPLLKTSRHREERLKQLREELTKFIFKGELTDKTLSRESEGMDKTSSRERDVGTDVVLNWQDVEIEKSHEEEVHEEVSWSESMHCNLLIPCLRNDALLYN